MSKRRRHQTAKEKGDFLEDIVASLHDVSNCKVEKKVMLRPKSGEGRPREIDVLLSSEIAGYPVQIPIECKNYKKKVGAPLIEAFVGKLQHLGLPARGSIFVSMSGFTKPADESAMSAGVMLLTLEELDQTQVRKEFHQALQSIIFISLTVTNIILRNKLKKAENQDLFVFWRDDKMVATIFDLIWIKWRFGEIPEMIGVHEFILEKPNDWYQKIKDEIFENKITITVQIKAHVLSLRSSPQYWALKDQDQNLRKFQYKYEFEKIDGTYPIIEFSSEEGLQSYLSRQSQISLSIGRAKVPRIMVNSIYWPLTLEDLDEIDTILAPYLRGDVEEIPDYDPSILRKTDLSAGWAKHIFSDQLKED